MAEQERRFLGLTHNPFDQQSDDFFELGERKTHLEQLQYLSQWSRRALLVTGPTGVGKTTLFRKLSASLEPKVQLARVNGMLVNTGREVLMTIARSYQLDAPNNADSQQLGDLITGYAERQESVERICVALVDDAEVLDPRAFDDLLELLARCPIRMVFFGEVRFFSPIKKAAGNFDVGWHEIHLSGFSPEDVQAYLEWRFKQASYRGRLPFTDRQVKEITRLSKGLPGRIDQIADVLLVKLESGDLIVGRSRFPVIHRAVLALLVVVIGVAYLIGQQTPFSWFDEQPDTLALEEPSAANEEPSAANKEPSAAVEEPSAANEEPLAAVEEPSAAAEEPSADNPGADSGKPKTADGSELSGSPENPPGNPGTENPPDRTSREPLPAKPDPPRSIREKPQAESAPTSPGFLYRDARWLMSQPGDTFTLQLFTFSSAERVQAYLADQERPRQFATYRISRDGQILHVVVYGAFATRTQAEAESLRLPASVGEVKPWVRTLAQVQDAIRTALQR